jgi:hypothetical protein
MQTRLSKYDGRGSVLFAILKLEMDRRTAAATLVFSIIARTAKDSQAHVVEEAMNSSEYISVPTKTLTSPWTSPDIHMPLTGHPRAQVIAT